MSFIKIINRYKFSIIAFIVTFFLLGYFFTEYAYNNYNARYVYVFESDSDNVEIVLDHKYYTLAIEKVEDYNKNAVVKISYANIDYLDMLDSAYLTIDDNYELSVLRRYFPTTVKQSNGLVNSGDERVVKYFNLMFEYFPLEITYLNLKVTNYQNPFIIGGICSGGSFLLLIILLLVGSRVGRSGEEIEDNLNVFSSIFHKKYWQGTNNFLRNVKSLCNISILFALMLICKMIPIPSGFGSLGIGLTYLVFASVSLIYGPICGIFIGFCSDILGFFLFQQGQVFFLGYTLDAMLSGFIYGICFYKKRITFTNCLIARFFVNIGVNVVLGSLWWKIIYNLNYDAYITYLLTISLPKNILYLLPQSIILFVLFKLLSKPLASFNLIDKKVSENITLF